MYAYKVIAKREKEILLKKMHKYPKDVFTYDVIRSLGVSSVRSIRRITRELEERLNDHHRHD